MESAEVRLEQVRTKLMSVLEELQVLNAEVCTCEDHPPVGIITAAVVCWTETVFINGDEHEHFDWNTTPGTGIVTSLGLAETLRSKLVGIL